MTRTKAWRLSLAAILGFGWLFLTPAYSNDPLTIAAQQISDLNNNLEKLNDKAETKRLIDIAQAKYDYALSTKENLINAQSTYDSAILSESEALSNKNIAQNAVNVQEPIKNNAYLDLQNKQTNLDAANINLVTAQSQYPSSGQPGLNAYLYDCWTPWNSYNSSPQIGCGASPIVMGPWTSMYWNFGGGGPAGLYDDYQIHLTGYIKQTQHWTPQFRSCGDDGMIIIINGNTVVNNWWDRGGGCGASNGFYMPNNDWVPIEIWWYENGGGAWGEAQWDIGNGFITIPSSVLSTDIPIISPEVIAAQDLQLLAQSEYDSALLIYNNENDKLIQYNSNLINATSIYDDAVFTKNIALNNLNFAQIEYDNAILEMQNAISNAQNEYNKQWDFEEKQRVAAAIAQSLANQPQPTPEPSPEISLSPSPEPTPEQTLPVDPTPEPTPEITPEVTPTPIPSPEISPEPTQEPSPQPTDINPSPSVEPTQDPSVVPDKTNNSPVDEQTANLIADLTNSNTLTKLTPEQKNAVAAVLGIKSEEIIKIAELAKSNEIIADALQQFGERANDNLNAPMPYTLADATTEIQAEKLLSDPIGVLLDIDLTKILSPSEWGKDMTDDQRKKTQEVVIPVIIASNIVAAAMTRRI